MLNFCRRLLFSCCLTFCICSNSLADELGGAVSFEKVLNDDSSILFDFDYRAIDNELFYRHYEVGYLRKFKNDWSARISHRFHYRYLQSQNDWKNGYTPFLAIFKNFRGKKIEIQHRFIHEYIFDNDGGNLNRNRYRIGAITSQSYNGFKPFIFDEAFYNYRTNRYFRNWLSIGTRYEFDKQLSFNLFYRHDHRQDPANHRYWHSRNGIFASAYYIF